MCALNRMSMLFSVLARKKWFQTPVSFSPDTSSGKWYDFWNCAQRVIKEPLVKRCFNPDLTKYVKCFLSQQVRLFQFVQGGFV